MPKKIKAKKQRFGLAVSVHAQLLLGLCFTTSLQEQMAEWRLTSWRAGNTEHKGAGIRYIPQRRTPFCEVPPPVCLPMAYQIESRALRVQSPSQCPASEHDALRTNPPLQEPLGKPSGVCIGETVPKHGLPGE